MMTTMKKFYYLICVYGLILLIAPIQVKAQQYPVFSQYYFNEMVINPAYAGNHVQLSLTSTYRNQWVNFPGAPRTISISGHTSLYDGKVGVGLLVNHDEIGSYGNQNVYGYYSYKIAFEKVTLSMGLQAGFNFLGVDFSKLDLLNPSDASFSSLNAYKPNFGTGVYLNFKNSFIGLSVPFILNSTLISNVSSIGTELQEARYYFLRGGTIQKMNPKGTLKINPSILVRAQEGQPLSMDLNLGVIIHDVVSTGVSWRSGDALIGFIDLKLSESFHFAYSFDMTGSELNNFSNGSHEFTLNYRTRIRSIHKNVECPDYYGYGINGRPRYKK
jgi:type IX secretion system PorP/SprF family membrane protein